MRQPRRLAADDDRSRASRRGALRSKSIAERGHALAAGVGFALPEFEGGVHADGEGDRFGAGSEARLVGSRRRASGVS